MTNNPKTRSPYSIIALCAVLAVTACAKVTREISPNTDVIVIGDSVMRWNSRSGSSIGDAIGTNTGFDTVNLAVSGAVFHSASGPDIKSQYRAGPQDWVVMNGGANDLSRNCKCRACDTTLAALITETGQAGQIPAFAQRVTEDGAQLLVLGYYDGPENGGPFSACDDELTELNTRLSRLASKVDGVWYVDAADVIDPATRSHYAWDRVHPSATGSQLIGRQISDVLLRVAKEAENK